MRKAKFIPKKKKNTGKEKLSENFPARNSFSNKLSV